MTKSLPDFSTFTKNEPRTQYALGKNEKLMLYYPKIHDQDDAAFGHCIGFEKLDGTNMHWCWLDGRIVSFGTRRDRYSFSQSGFEAFGIEHRELKSSIDVFHEIGVYGFYEPEITSPLTFATREEAVTDAREWAKDEGVEYKE